MIILKKIIITLFIVTVLFCLTTKTSGEVLIPSNAIRFRIIANSNSLEDQEIKIKIREEIEPVFAEILEVSQSKEETKELIDQNIPIFESILNKYDIDYTINYGNNYFPEKEYKGIVYPEGNYESLVITLGSGLGENWWCVLFPPLCLLEATEEETNSTNYTFYIKEVLEKFS